MRQDRARRFLGLAVFGLSLWAMASGAHAEECRFTYGEQARQAFIVPELKRRLGVDWAVYDDPKPLVSIRKSTVVLIFQPRETAPAGYETLDAPIFIVELPECGARLGPAAFQPPYVVTADQPQL